MPPAPVELVVTYPPFSLLYDYRCPFARIVHNHVLAAMDAGLALDITFEPFTLTQGHIAPGDRDAWDDPALAPTLLALEVSVAVRDSFSEAFLPLHRSLFEARHAQGIALTSREQLAPLLSEAGLDPDVVFDLVDAGGPRTIIAERWTHYHDDLDVFGVPTFVFDDADATFIRLMTGPDASDLAASIPVVERLLDLLVNHTDLNEFKHTRLSR